MAQIAQHRRADRGKARLIQMRVERRGQIGRYLIAHHPRQQVADLRLFIVGCRVIRDVRGRDLGRGQRLGCGRQNRLEISRGRLFLGLFVREIVGQFVKEAAKTPGQIVPGRFGSQRHRTRRIRRIRQGSKRPGIDRRRIGHRRRPHQVRRDLGPGKLAGQRRVTAMAAGQELGRILVFDLIAQQLQAVPGGSEGVILGDHAADVVERLAQILGPGRDAKARVSHGAPRSRRRDQSRPMARRTRSRLSPCLLVCGAFRTAL